MVTNTISIAGQFGAESHTADLALNAASGIGSPGIRQLSPKQFGKNCLSQLQ